MQAFFYLLANKGLNYFKHSAHLIKTYRHKQPLWVKTIVQVSYALCKPKDSAKKRGFEVTGKACPNGAKRHIHHFNKSNMKQVWLEKKEQNEWSEFELLRQKKWDEWNKKWGNNGEKEKALREKQATRRNSKKLGLSKSKILKIRKSNQQQNI